MPPTTPHKQIPSSTPCTPSTSTSTTSGPLTPTTTSIDVKYQIVQIKPTDSDWVTPRPTDHIQIAGPVPRGKTHTSNPSPAFADKGIEIPCVAFLVWGDRSIHLTCLYYPAASLFTDFRASEDNETAKATDRADKMTTSNSVVVPPVEGAIFHGGETESAMTLGEDKRDDNGIPFLVLHVQEGLGGSARLYCKKVYSR